MVKKILPFFLLFIASAINVQPAHAQFPIPPGGFVPIPTNTPIIIPTNAMIKITNLGKVVSGLIGVFLLLAALAAFIYLLWGGFQWITSGGDKAQVEAARNRIQAALLGLLIVFASWAIFTVVEGFLGISILGTGLQLPDITGN